VCEKNLTLQIVPQTKKCCVWRASSFGSGIPESQVQRLKHPFGRLGNALHNLQKPKLGS
jgi:hypothetical protein